MRISLLLAFMLILFCVKVQAQNAYILSFADIHFDPFIDCNNQAPCPLIDKLSKTDVSKWAQLFSQSGETMSVFKEDTNYTLLNSSLSDARTIAQKQHPTFVIVAGDFLGHEFRWKYHKYAQDKSSAAYHAFIYKTLAFLNYQLHAAFPDTDIYCVVGNNDSYQDNYVSDPGGQFFHDIGKLWASLLKNSNDRLSMQNEFATAGYYALDLPEQKNVRLIVLNTNLFSYLARGKNLDQAAMKQLAWLHQQLQVVKANKQKAIIAMHIPEGIDIFASFKTRLYTLIHLWSQKYMTAFDAEIKQNSVNIMAIFAGHLHADWFQMINLDNTQTPESGTPSVSPIYGNNPGFKTYTYTPAEAKLEGFVTYFYPLSYRRSLSMEYGFNQYQHLQCEDCKTTGGEDLVHQTSLLPTIANFFTPANINQNAQWSAFYQCAIQRTQVLLPACDAD